MISIKYRTVQELKSIVKSKGIKGYSSLHKAELLDLFTSKGFRAYEGKRVAQQQEHILNRLTKRGEAITAANKKTEDAYNALSQNPDIVTYPKRVITLFNSRVDEVRISKIPLNVCV